jgi:pyruvate dehydrogenase E2 component (dihydrolipoamide acetyltransferase)
MATFEFVLPELGEGMEAGDVVQVLVTVGDSIAEEQPVLELETDKAVVEVPAPVSGTVKAIHIQAGDKAAVGQLLLTVETPAAAMAAPAAPRTPAPAAVPAPPPAEHGAQRTVTDNAAPGLPALPSRTPPVAPGPDRGAGSQSPEQPSGPPRPAVPAAPSVRQLAREIGVDITQVPGSGPEGRISLEDVKRYARDLHIGAAGQPRRDDLPAITLPDFAKWGAVQRQPMSNVRRATAERMAQSWATIPHVTQFDQADITDLEELRQHYDAQQARTTGGKLTITAIVLKVIAAALKRFPQFNASIDMSTSEVIHKTYYHIGVAVDTERGLLVPVIRDVDQKNIRELCVELPALAERARNRKITLEELQGGTFTITNLGGLGGTNFTPIINAPEVAILGLARSRREPVYNDSTGQWTPRLMLPLALSYDHRLIDGADGIRFLRWVVEMLEQPFLLALEA